jgi:hypothetical protein
MRRRCFSQNRREKQKREAPKRFPSLFSYSILGITRTALIKSYGDAKRKDGEANAPRPFSQCWGDGVQLASDSERFAVITAPRVSLYISA